MWAFLGARVLFHVLAQFGQAELAFKMIVGPGFPSYGFWLENGATSLWENFRVSGRTASRNHHFWGDIGSWFIRYLSGIRLNPLCRDVNRVDIAPCFVGALKYAKRVSYCTRRQNILRVGARGRPYYTDG